MKYYKIIKNNTFIGIANSNNFIAYQNANHMFIGANEETGDLVECNNKFYRGLWMKPMNTQIAITYETADIIEISYEEYTNFQAAIDNNETIEYEEDTIVIPEPPPIDNPEMGLDFIRSSKLDEMSYTCRMTIEAGIDLELRGEIHHFSLTTQDQLNLISLSAMAQTQSLIPYHADGEECEFYTAEEINQIISEATTFKNYHLSYYNSLKAYINTLDTIEAIAAITYGTPIPDEYKSDVLKVLE